MKIILGSSSKYRQKILRDAGYEFDVVSPDIDEKAIRFDDPEKLTMALAHAKADAIREKLNERVLLITADQVIVCNGEIREKPESDEDARAYLLSYAQHPIKSVTSIVVTDTETNKRFFGTDIAHLEFYPFSEDIIDKLIKDGEIFSCAGAFTISNSTMKRQIKNINGDADSIIGLPIGLTEGLIELSKSKEA